ncbi:prephenate dehydrogenase/arogenate dehydrogenase family protein, partial [Microbispora sp. GKU 823]|uniref:prephenate dehydrogenase/arogenate dehydrogenase family protein n=1 Tax=Microbispora sp. GKU 823 TaxID=1652100 RepID=UPI00118158C9
RLGAGLPHRPGDPAADVVVVATPPSAVPRVLRDAQARGLGAVYTDVASTKGRLLAEAEAAGCDLATYVPGHPLAGGESSGPAAARGSLFAGRSWALCPHPATSPKTLAAVAELVRLCGAEAVLLPATAHDRVAAAVSHAPHLVSSALAARFADADETTLSLVGQGLRDVTRIAGGASGLWRDILEQNADAVATVLEQLVEDLAMAAAALRGRGGAAGDPPTDPLTDLLVRGNRGRELIVRARDAKVESLAA